MKYLLTFFNIGYKKGNIIIILTLVYGSFYKIIKEYSGSYFNKQEIILLILNSTFFFKIRLANK